MSRPVIILGMHRSGTSCLTGSLQEAGLQLGDVNKKTKCNEKGTRENQSIMDLNDGILANAGASWDHPPEGPVVWREEHKALRDSVLNGVMSGGVWGFKDPRTLFTFDGWIEALPDAKLIASVRDPFAVARSLNLRNGFPIERGLVLWRAYNERLLSVCRERDVALINFDWSPERYRAGLSVLSAEIGLAPPADGFTFFETRLRKSEAAPQTALPEPLRGLHRRLKTLARLTMHRARDEVATPALLSTDKKKGLIRDQNIDSDERPGALDSRGDRLARENRWPAADEAYRKAQRVRGVLLGFRGRNGGRAEAPTDRAEARARLGEFCKLAARFGAQYWANNLTASLTAATLTNGSRGHAPYWPRGAEAPSREFVRIRQRPDNIERKKLSIMIPVYGITREDWFREAIDGVLAQISDAEEAEIVVVDDASTDDAAQNLVAGYGGRVQYQRNQTNLGLVGNHNHCIGLSRGDFVHILHQDDRVSPGFYDALLPTLSRDARFVAGLCNTAYIDASGIVTSKTPQPQDRGALVNWPIALSLQFRIQFPSIIVRRRTYETVGGFSPSLKFSFDWDLWNHVAASGPVWFEPGHLAEYRVHEGSATYEFGWLERVQDAMQTVSHMVRLVDGDARRAIAEMAMHKFFLRYWTTLSQTAPDETDADQQSLIDFFLSGWTTPDEHRDLGVLFAELRLAAAR